MDNSQFFNQKNKKFLLQEDGTMFSRKKLFCFIVICLTLTAWVQASWAGYYDGKTISIVSATNPGSGADLNCRFMAQHWEKHFPGKTKLIVKNMKGGSKGLNYVYEKAKPDGMTIYNGSYNPMGVLTGQPGLRYKIEDLIYIGGANGYFFAMTRTDACSNPSDILKSKKLVAGGINPSLTIDIASQLSLDLLGVDYRYVTGFRGMPKIKTALLANEVQFTTSGYAGYRNFFRDTSLKSGDLTIMWYHPTSDEKGSNPFPGARSFVDVYKEITGKKLSGTKAEAYYYLRDQIWQMVNNIIAPPGTPSKAVAELRKTFKAMFEDEAFQKDWEKRYDTRFEWIDGETGDKLMKNYKQVSPEAVELFVDYKLQRKKK